MLDVMHVHRTICRNRKTTGKKLNQKCPIKLSLVFKFSLHILVVLNADRASEQPGKLFKIQTPNQSMTILYVQFCELLLSSCFISHHHYSSTVFYFFFLWLQLWFLISPDPLLFTQQSSRKTNPFKNVITAAFSWPSNLPQWMNRELVTIIHSVPLLSFGSLTDGHERLWPSVVTLWLCG